MAEREKVETLDVNNVWRPRARMARRRASHTYGAVVLLLVVEFIFIAAAPDEYWAVAALLLLQGCTLFLALWTTGLGKEMRPLLPLALPLIAAAVAVVLLESGTAVGLVALLNATLVVATVAVLIVGIVDQAEVNTQSVTGAVCAYLLLGFLFNFLFGAVAALGNGPFFANGSDGTPFERLYFSFVTLATLGYGDYSAGEPVGRSLAVAEVLIGQLFLVTAVGLLIGLLVSARAAPQTTGDEPADLP